MPHPELVLRSLSVLLTEAFFTGLWQGTAVALAVVAMLRVLPRAGAEALYVTLRVAFVLLVVLPWFHVHHAALPQTEVGAAVQVLPVVATVIAVLWALMALTRAAQLLMAYRHLRAVWRRAVPLAATNVDLQPLDFGKRQIVLCISADVDSPTVLGFRRPRLLLPKWLAPTLTGSDLQQIALHECEHLSRRDDWMNLLQQVALVALPLHPALLWLNCRLNLQRELACDAGVVARTSEPIAYATCLTRLAEQRLQHRQRVRLALAAWEQRSELARRVHALLKNDTKTYTPAQSRFAAAAITFIFAAGALLMTRAPQLVHVKSDEAPSAVVAAVGASAAFHPDLSYSVPMQKMSYQVPASAPDQPLRRAAVAKGKMAAVLPSRLAPRKHVAMRRGILLTSSSNRSLVRAFHRQARLTTTEFTHSYAAIPLGDGWLLIQL